MKNLRQLSKKKEVNYKKNYLIFVLLLLNCQAICDLCDDNYSLIVNKYSSKTTNHHDEKKATIHFKTFQYLDITFHF